MTIETKLVRRSFDRRGFLRGLGTAALVMPPLLRARQASAAARKNVVIFYVGGGLDNSSWYQAGRTSGAIGERPLTGALSLFDAKYPALRNKLTLIEGAYGLWQKFPDGSNLFAHDRSTQCALNCSNPDDADQAVSLDRRFAEHLQTTQTVPFASLMLCASRGWKFNGRGDISRGGSASLSTMFTDPVKTYERVFMGVTGGPVAGGVNPETGRMLEKGILSSSLEQCEAVKKQAQTQMGLEAARKVSDQCDALRDMEKRLSTMAPSGAGRCTVPEKPAGTFGTASTLHETLDAFRRLGANALSCARTNVVLVEVWRDQPDETAKFQSAPEFQKLIIHLWHFHRNNGGGDQNLVKRARTDLDNRTVEEFAKWGTELEGLGLLDDGLVLWATNEPRGDHSINGPLPCMYMGSMGGRLRTGTYHRVAESMGYGNDTVVPSINEVYAALLRSSGLNTDRHGPARHHRTGSVIPNKLLV